MNLIVLLLAVLARGGEAVLVSAGPAAPDVLHWQDIQSRGVNFTGMVRSSIRSIPSHAPARIFTYDASEDVVISKAVQTDGTWEQDKVQQSCSLLQSMRGGNFLDVGANIGTYTIPLVSCLGQSARGYAIEAVPGNAERVMASVLANRYRNVVVVPNAVGSPSDPPAITINVNIYSKGASTRTNERGADQVVPTKVKLTTLDAIAERAPGMRRVFFMKMDIEGSEGRALQGARSWMSESPPCWLFVELNPQLLAAAGTPVGEVVALLHGFGYDTAQLPAEIGGDYFLPQRDMPRCRLRFR